MAAVRDYDQFQTLSKASLLQLAAQLSDGKLVHRAMAKVVRHYQPSAVCLVMESGDALHVTASYQMPKGRLPLSSITRHVTGRPLPIIILDASSDARFEDDALVVGPPHARFFVGAPVIVKCTVVGSLCLLDAKQRKDFTLEECSVIVDAAEAVGQHWENASVTAMHTLRKMMTEALPSLEEMEEDGSRASFEVAQPEDLDCSASRAATKTTMIS